MSHQAKAFGQALFQLGQEEGLSQLLFEQFELVDALWQQHPEYVRLLDLVSLPKEERTQLLDQVFGQSLHPYLLHCLKLVTRAAYNHKLHESWLEFRHLYDQQQGIVRVQAVSAIPMTEGQKQALRQKLEQVTGKQVGCSYQVEATCLGGVRRNLRGNQLDGTVEAQLERLRRLLAQPV